MKSRKPHDKRALVCYLVDAVRMRDSDPRLKGNANWWMAREICRILDSLGYSVDVIASGDRTTTPPGPYDLVFDASYNLPRLAAWQKPETKYCVLLTGSCTVWSQSAEACRIADFERNHGVPYAPRFGWQSRLLEDMTLSLADVGLLVGNDVTLSTYPEWARKKITPVRIPASPVRREKKYGKRTGSFLYFSSARNVLKGLDLVLDAFLRHKEWMLHIVGPVESSERDFWKAYPEVAAGRVSNIVLHGSMVPSSEKFAKIVDECDALVFPSCSEGTSSSVLTCCQTGLYPILSRNSGVDFPAGCGIWIETLSAQGVETAIGEFEKKDWSGVADAGRKMAEFISARHSRAAFSKNMEEILRALRDAPEEKRIHGKEMPWYDALPESVRRTPVFTGTPH